ncbi:hypothetical protein ACOME3_006164 [Neoechinorhynchus agilis]
MPLEINKEILFPGDVICTANGVAAGEGTYILSGQIRSSVVGDLEIKSADDLKGVFNSDESADKNLIVSVIPRRRLHPLPMVGQIVCCKVIGFSDQSVSCTIFAAADELTNGDFRGIIRREDIIAHGKETVNIYDHFQIGDIVVARVICLGDSDGYFLSTTEPELGVIVARCKDGHLLKPVCYDSMLCPVTKRPEKRKVSKVQDAYTIYA